MKFSTRAIHAGQEADPTTGAVVMPIYQTVTYKFKGIDDPMPFEYSRVANPTRSALEECLASLEGATGGLCFASGMAAIDAVVSILKPGDHILSAAQIYGGTFRHFEHICRPRGIEISYVDCTDPENFRRAMTPGTKLVWIESPTNPLLQLTDIAAVAAIAHAGGAKLVIDNTFATPYFQRPLELGADVVVHSMTKYIGGHSDVLGGAVLTNDLKLHGAFKFYQKAAGGVLAPFDSWLALRGLKTLAVRMRQHEANAIAIAQFLKGHPRVRQTLFPGLPEHPQHELAKKQMSGFGAMVSFEIDGGRKEADQFVRRLKVFTFGESLGGVESLAAHPATMSHASMSPEEREKAGITEGMIRLSIGIEDIDDLRHDLDQALK
ncbi:cystathionine gamma-synthase [bacterium]|nr:cystathionine gamma-synthase [bacterium]